MVNHIEKKMNKKKNWMWHTLWEMRNINGVIPTRWAEKIVHFVCCI